MMNTITACTSHVPEGDVRRLLLGISRISGTAGGETEPLALDETRASR